MSENRCVSCGDIIPEGIQYCKKCFEGTSAEKEIKRLKNKAKFYYELVKSNFCGVIYDEELEKL